MINFKNPIDHPKVYTQTYPIHVYELNHRLQVSIQSICNYLQDAPVGQLYAHELTVPQMRMKNLTWFLSRLHIRMLRYPAWRQGLTLQTWPSGVDRLLTTREYLLLEGESVVGAARTAWLLLDTQKKRLLRPNTLLEDVDLLWDKQVFDTALEKLPALGTDNNRRDFEIRRSDVDMNDHVNMVKYVDWMLETIPESVQLDHQLRDLEINFLAEARFGEPVRASADRLESPGPETDTCLSYLHRLQLADGKESARARSVWLK